MNVTLLPPAGHPQARESPTSSPAQATVCGRLLSELFKPVPIASLVFLRVAFGAVMLWEVWRYFDNDWIRRFYIEPKLFFTYYGFGWVKPWPQHGMYLHFAALGLLAACILVGYCYRLAAVLFWLGFTYVFLLDESRYLNHFYLISLLSFLLVFVPAHRALSVDAWRRPQLASGLAPAWALWLLRAQIGLVYFYGGIAKLNVDWLQGEPMRMWLARRTDFPVIGQYFTAEWMVLSFVWGGLLLDLLIVPLLLYRRTRWWAFLAAVAFHLMNARLFEIGIFPWFMLLATMIFFPPDWPRRVVSIFRRQPDPDPNLEHQAAAAIAPTRVWQRAIIALWAIYLGVQLVAPLRHFAYPGRVDWTEEGHRFSWHMKLRCKKGRARFIVIDATSGRKWRVDPRKYLDARQYRKMAVHPDMILQFSHYLAEEKRRAGYPDVRVYARVTVSLNGREPQFLIDPDVDLAQERRNLLPAVWIMPLHESPTPIYGEKGAHSAL
jgi:hypothetical protein